MRRALIPLLVFGLIVVVLALGLGRDPKLLPSPLLGKPVPSFALAQLHAPEQMFGPEQLKGKPWVLNVWASWCAECRNEHPLLMQWAAQKSVALVGLDYKDQSEAGKTWLARFGNPYSVTLSDLQGKVGIDLGVYGVPETFLIDAQGVIRYKHVGPLTPEVIEQKFMTLIRDPRG